MNNSSNSRDSNPNSTQADSEFFDDANSDIDVPVYRRDAEREKKPEPRDPYTMAGRARPQRIEAAKPEPQSVEVAPAAEPEPEPVIREDPAFTEPAKAVPVSATETTGETPVVPAAAAEPEVATDKPVREKRGTLGFGLLLLRLVVGGLLLVQGLQTLFAFGDNGGLNVLERHLTDHSHADLLAVGLSAGAVVAGGLLILGLLTPFGAAIGAVVAGFFALHFFRKWDGGYWPSALDTEVQMWAILAAVAVAILFTGPGRISFDRSRGWATRPLASAWLFAIIAGGALAALWFLTA
ncbi:DoxX family membrane protein [Corynebacterium dentalis]|uniref:DoxX family membrane protein n=1 Tax=Corynebacterium dentalis TaxID=2014528 RepID=UPI00289E41E8|nr:DoxX family membrane protein [Corynebacterium dentalis]